MSVTVTITLNGIAVPVELDDAAIATIAAAITPTDEPAPASPYMTIIEAAAFLCCSRQRIDDLLSQRRLSRFKDGARTLVSRAEIEAHLQQKRRS